MKEASKLAGRDWGAATPLARAPFAYPRSGSMYPTIFRFVPAAEGNPNPNPDPNPDPDPDPDPNPDPNPNPNPDPNPNPNPNPNPDPDPKPDPNPNPDPNQVQRPPYRTWPPRPPSCASP